MRGAVHAACFAAVMATSAAAAAQDVEGSAHTDGFHMGLGMGIGLVSPVIIDDDFFFLGPTGGSILIPMDIVGVLRIEPEIGFFHYATDEEDGISRFQFTFRCEAHVAERVVAEPPETPHRLRLRCTFLRIRCAVGTRVAGGGVEFDTEQPDPDHFLAGLGEVVGRSFDLLLEPRTGAVSDPSGAETIAKVVASTRQSKDQPP